MGDYLDGRLGGRDRERLELHLADCPHCSEYLAQLRVTMDALGYATPEALPDEAVEELVGLYRRWRSDDSGSECRPRSKTRDGTAKLPAVENCAQAQWDF